MTRYAAFLRGVNLGKRTVRSAELKAGIEGLGYAKVKTLLASGNVLLDAPDADEEALRTRLEAGLLATFDFAIGVVLRTTDELRALIASDPYGGVAESEAAKLHVMLSALPLPDDFRPRGVPDDFDIPRVGPREVFIIAYRKPDGTYLAGSQLDLEKQLPRGLLVTSRNWNTILKAAA